MLTYIAIAIALFFAMNIGASGAAATMGIAYGSGAVKTKWVALVFVAIGVFLGSVLGSGEVVKMIGGGIVPSDILTVQVVVIILFSATFSLFMANLLGIPLSTSEVTVGSIVGAGVAFQVLFVKNILVIVSFWLIVPAVAFIMAIICGKLIQYLERRFPVLQGQGKWKRILAVLVILAGMFEAFSAGMNNVANAVGPIIGAGLMSESAGVFWGGLFVALGAILMGGRVMETNGKRITNLSLLQGTSISGTGGLLVMIASLYGLPVPLAQVTTSAIMGIGTADNGFRIWQKNIMIQIIQVWLVSPVLSLVICYALIKALLDRNLYVLVAIGSVFLATVGIISLYQTVRKEKTSMHEDGGGI